MSEKREVIKSEREKQRKRKTVFFLFVTLVLKMFKENGLNIAKKSNIV